MKNLKIGWSLSIVTLTLAVSGCGSQGDDPGKNYQDIRAKATVNADGTNKPAPQIITRELPPTQDPQKICTQPFILSAKDDKGNKLLTFTENKESTYEVTVRSQMGQQFNIDTVNLTPTMSADFHSGRAHFNIVKQEANVATYNLTWKPGKLANGQALDVQLLDLKYSSAPSKICGNDIRDQLNLLVQPDKPAASSTAGGNK